ncbi:S-adenosyl-L-methionine-dependent methyltransferase [Glarea lozoyensis ATCC 20868]|uniref:S-adenosyl-L-methionine-dependent methyltransferase n=1 Tax=Glarea lozoyensis (strain ATCC 20868 / MF5171) TaxID=1116229 RepID=S3CT51_GLAL2|nr:S-adenosyl-L-methionine-dependent methyltransferase [Glarea lozoyensis ATCC 20868]EPE28805.1 S-adenosyl-L-methionine-dependent methyltransferase [Glarea lozoyensis ATCC 20868]
MDAQLQEFQNLFDKLSASKDEVTRKALLNICRSQTGRLETPWETVWRMIMEPHQSAALRAALEMGLIDALASSTTPLTSTQLSEKTNCNEKLITRILRPLAVRHLVKEASFETYTSSPVTSFLSQPGVAGGFKFMFDIASRCTQQIPSFLAQDKFASPSPQGVFEHTFSTPLPMFPWLQAHPNHMKDFGDLMMGQQMGRVPWFDVADVDQVLFESKGGEKKDEVLLVDVGGGRGYDLQAFKTRFPDGDGKLVLQDLPMVVEDIQDLDEAVVRQVHDFFTPQPVRDAKAYYLRYILHDYSDEKCQEILKHIVDAMTPGYSKLLIFEWVLPDTESALFPSLLDINMMALLGGMERTQSQWKVLLEGAGLEVRRFWGEDKEAESLIECVRK